MPPKRFERNSEELNPLCVNCPNFNVSCYGADRTIEHPDCHRGRLHLSSVVYRRLNEAYGSMVAAMEELRKALEEFPLVETTEKSTSHET